MALDDMLAAIQAPQQAAPQAAGGAAPPMSATQRAIAAATKGRASKKAGMYQQIQQQLIEIDDPLEREFARASFEDLFSDMAGRRVPIRDPADEAAFQLARQKEAMQLQKDIATLEVEQVQAAMDGLDPKVQAQIGYKRDLLSSDPDAFLAALTRIAPDSGIHAGTLRLAGKLTEESPEDVALGKASKQTSQRVGLIENKGKLAKAGQEYMEGEGVLGPGKSEAIAAAESAFSSKLTGMGDTDIDEDKGSGALLDVYRSERKRVGVDLGPAVVAQSFLKQFGSDIADNLEGLPTDEQGRLIVGVGDAGVTDRATFNLTAFLFRAAADGDRPVGEVLREIGLPYTDVDSKSFLSAAARYAQEGKVELGDFLADLGLGVSASE